MPATYGAVHKSIEKTFELNTYEIDEVLDVGSGTGTATWACFEHFGNKKYTCLEREKSMIEVGKMLMENHQYLKDTEWIEFDASKENLNRTADLVICSYMINELNKDIVEKIVKQLWDATKKVLVIIEPGTPHGFSNIKNIRDIVLKKGGNIIAPCTHQCECKIPQDDWCGFSCRVQRSKIHKKLKEGTVGFEDEKFSYIAFSKNEAKRAENRILRHPIINKGYSEFKVCTSDGIKSIKLSKKDGQIYKNSKKKNAGDILDL